MRDTSSLQVNIDSSKDCNGNDYSVPECDRDMNVNRLKV